MFRIKICGVRRVSDIAATAVSGADAVGLNFFRQSIRYVEPELAIELSSEAEDRGLLRVGVFVDEAIDSILDISDRVGLDFVQLHGHESEPDAQRLLNAGERVIRAIRLPVGRLEPQEVEERVAPWRELGCDLLLDADAGAQAGGAGLRLDWAAIGRWRAEYATQDSWALAGGLTPQTVAKAVALTGASAVDVASGVEQPRGIKSAALIEAFVENCGPLGQ
ncbi:MAG: phosphoribosylanthranilate isomerase [Planctomycetaceae bacterium]